MIPIPTSRQRHRTPPPARLGAVLLASLLVAPFLALATAGNASAQNAPARPDDGAGTTGSGTTGTDATAAPSMALAVRLDSIGVSLAGSTQPTSPPIDLEVTAARVAGLAGEVESRTALARPETLGSLAPAVIDSLVASLERIDRDLDRSRRELGAVAAQLESRRAALKADGDFLKAVLAVVGSDELPPTLFERSRAALAEIGTTRAALRMELDGLARLDGELSDLRLAVTGTVGEIQALRAARAAEVFGREQPPLWAVLDRLRIPLGTLRNIATATAFAVQDYVRDYPTQWTALAILLAVLLLLSFLGRGAGSTAAAAGEPEPGAGTVVDPISQRPIAVPVLVWLVIGPRLFGLDLPLAVDFLRIAVAAVAVWRLLPLLVSAGSSRAATGVLVLTVVATSALLAGPEDANTRVLIVGIGIAAVLLLRRLARAGGEESAQLGRLWGRVLRVAVWLGQYVAAAGVLADIVGAVSLGNQLVYGTLFGVVVPLLLAVTSQVLRGLIARSLAQPPLNGLRAVRLYPDVVRNRLAQAVDLALVLLALPVLPRLFPFVAPVFAAVGDALRTPLAVGGLNVSLFNVATLAIGLALALGAARLVRFLLEEEVFPRTPVQLGSASTASRLIYYVLVMVGLFMALAAAGFELSQLTLLVSALGVGIGFGLQNIVNNFVSGIVLAFERPFQPGDMVAVGTMTGRVREIGLRATTVRTFEGADVIVPNSQFISGEVINWTLADRSRRIEIPVGVAYGTDLRRAQEVLRSVVADHPDVMPTPEPNVVFRRFGDSSIDFSVLFWAADADQAIALTSAVGMAIWEALDAAGIVIPFPQRDVHLIAAGEAGDAATAPATAATPPPAAPRTGESRRAAATPPEDPD